jgi:methyltransferase of ATP-grasp peptide maturase system
VTATTSPDAAQLRRLLADRLYADGWLRSAAWRHAIETVPREVFLGGRVYRRVDTAAATLWEPLTPDSLGKARWLELAYENTTWVTQFDASDTTPDGTLQGAPTSSSTLPGLVIGMLEDLDVHDGQTVLEIGTGTGYSTALLCQRLGDSQVTSIELDPGVATRAKTSLNTAGYAPTLVTGDGLAGHAHRAPYDRIIATCSVRSVPTAWLSQTSPGGRILVTLSGWLYGSGLLALQVTDGRHAHGRFLPGTVSFMPARADAAPPLGAFPAREGQSRPTVRGADILNDWMGRFLAQLAAPGAQRARLMGDADAPPADLVIDQATGAYAWLTKTGALWNVQQAGPTRLWDDIEAVLDAWDSSGRPGLQEFHLRVRAQRQEIYVPGAPALSFHLPTLPNASATPSDTPSPKPNK